MKTIKKCLSYLISPFAIGLFVTAVISYTSFVYYSNHAKIGKETHPLLSILLQLHEKTIDWRFSDRGFIPGSDRVAILAIDESAVEQEGRWPWPRDKIGKLVDKTIELGAKVIAFDAVFPEPDPNSSISSLQRMRRELLGKSQLTADIEGLISEEMVRTDGDLAFADMIKKHADRLVMGAYFDGATSAYGYQDLCIDALYEKSAEARYWMNESQPLTVVDESLNRLAFPPDMKERIKEYATLLEMKHASAWFDGREGLEARITGSLEDLSDVLTPELYPGIATLWINNDIESAIYLLQETKPELATPTGARILFDRFAAAFKKNETAAFSTNVRESVIQYCGRFLSNHDELLHRDKYKTLWGDSPESNENYAVLSWESLWPQIQANRHPAGDIEKFEDAVARLQSYSSRNVVSSVYRWWLNIPVLGASTKHTGHFNSTLDTDGSVRRNMIVVRKGNSYAPSLALKTFLLDKGYNAVIELGLAKGARTNHKTLKSIEIKDAKGAHVMTIPASDEGRLMINYSGSRKMFPHVSAAEILNDLPKMAIERQIQNPKTGQWGIIKEEVSKSEFLKDKLLIFGATAVGIYDLRVTPFEENYPGVETHANVLSNLLVEHDRQTRNLREPASVAGFMSVHPSEPRMMLILLLGIGFVLSALLSYFGSVPGLGITALFMGGVYAIDRFFLFRNGIVSTVLFPMLEISGTFVTLTFYKYFTEERKKRELKGTFEKYVSPSIVAEVLKDPENIELGGKKMQLTVMFSDVRGFTTISEKLDPRALSDLLNSYLTPMTDLVFKNKGTLDKYMGDAIMAFWGAPIHFNDHAHHACRCALQMLGKLKELQAEYRTKGLPEIDIGIGLNTGDMSVGNMGSETVRSYTVMGDSVNLGSRLEGINKEYGTRIIISEFTYEAVKDSFVTREVDWVRVKGKAQPVRIFELIAEGQVPPDMDAALKHFYTGFSLYHERNFKEAVTCFQEALKHKPDDAPSQIYIKRCENYLEEPPPENWDGVYNMKSK